MSETDVTVDPQTAPDPALTKWVPVQGPALPPTAGQASKVLTVTTDGAAPTWAPPTGGSGGGASITYRGDYAAGTTYHDGDYVVGPDGYTYQCVKEGTLGVTPAPWSPGVWVQIPPVVNGQWLKGVAGGMVWSPITPADVANIPYATTFPASPYDGQEAILVDSTTNPQWKWRFRYNAASISPYKWEFIGGAPYKSIVLGGINVTFPSSSTLIPGGAGVTVPRTGDYIVDWSTQMQGGPISAFILTVALWNGTGEVNVVSVGSGSTGNYTTYPTVGASQAPFSAGTVLQIEVRSDQGNSVTFGNNIVTLTPRRVQ